MRKVIAWLYPFFLLLLGTSILLVYEFYIKEHYNTIQVVVAKEPIEYKQRIDLMHLLEIRVPRDQKIATAYQTIEELVSLGDLHAAIKIEAGTQLYPGVFQQYQLVPSIVEGEFVAPIPREWLFAVPGSLRRGYVIDFYAILPQTVDSKPWRLSQSPILENIRVVHTRDATNKEVRNSPDRELDATANIAALEVLVNQESFSLLKQYIDQGFIFYITYKDEGDVKDG